MGFRAASRALGLALCVSEAVSQVAHLPMVRHTRTHASSSSAELSKRDPASTGYALDDRINAWLVNVTIGTPGQTVQLQFDTGSADIWAYIPGGCTTNAKSENNVCDGGSYDPKKSKTAGSAESEVGTNDFVGTYGGGSANGTYYTDTVEMAGLKVNNQVIAAVDSGLREGMGIFGASFAANEMAASRGGKSFDTFMTSLVKQGLIGSQSYSIWMNGDDNTGSLLLGGYDTEKYTGELLALPIQPADDGSYRFLTVTWTFLGSDDGQGNISSLTSGAIQSPVIIDSGTSFMSLPSDVYNGLLDFIGFQTSDDVSEPYLPCDAADGSDYKMVFGFGGDDQNLIEVPVGNFISTDSIATDDKGDKLCGPAFDQGSDDQIVFGDTFMRAAYVIANLDSKMLYMAQAAPASDKSNVVAIGGSGSNSGSAIASLTATATASAAANASSRPDNGGQDQGSVSVTATGVQYTASAHAAAGTQQTTAAGPASTTSHHGAAAATGVVDISKVLFAGAVAAVGLVGV